MTHVPIRHRRGDDAAVCLHEGESLMRSLGEVLVTRGLITAAELEEAERTHREHRASGSLTVGLGRSLVLAGLLTDHQLADVLADQLDLRRVELDEMAIDHAAVARVPGPVCRRHTAIPVAIEGRKLLVAMADPGDVVAIDDLRSASGLGIRVAVAPAPDITAAIDRFFRADSEFNDLTNVLDTGTIDDELAAIKEVVDDAPIVRYVNLLIGQAIQDRASDIHLEPAETDLRVRFRIDGVLHEVMRSPRSIQSGVISRLKIMADIDIAERRIPQDGRLSVNHNGQKIDLRVATLPTVWGEKVVMRILDNSTARLTLGDLGFSDDNYARYSASFTKPYGMILVTGPTGSGKSTTLYSTLNIVNKPEVNIITVEDPVEYRLPGVNQVQVNSKAGLTFASALRSILRSDPDVVLVGEIRDQETAKIAIEAALTGHLVLSTLHTNDASSAISRLGEMGVEPFLLNSAIDCVLAQRLARRLCVKCREPYEPTPESLLEARVPWNLEDGIPKLWRPVGCTACSKTGYRGRVALHEVMPMSDELQRLTAERAGSLALDAAARAEGMVSLRDDGMAKALEGLTSLAEVMRVVA